MKQELRKCVKCGKTIKSISPMRKYCYDCRIEMRKVWFENFKKKKAGEKQAGSSSRTAKTGRESGNKKKK
ncbi:hypothetical protein D6764_01980 [Candidatus Woesearchaeota archaeon]|nr:MAG: hypothetical protein D6764_01980 [Candidatus Woesearchaeota archaeon]